MQRQQAARMQAHQQAEAERLRAETAAAEKDAERVATEAAQIAANREAFLLKQASAISLEAAQVSLFQQAKDYMDAHPLPKEWQWNWCTERNAMWYVHMATGVPTWVLPTAAEPSSDEKEAHAVNTEDRQRRQRAAENCMATNHALHDPVTAGAAQPQQGRAQQGQHTLTIATVQGPPMKWTPAAKVVQPAAQQGPARDAVRTGVSSLLGPIETLAKPRG